MIEVEVSSIRVSLMGHNRVVLLKDIQMERYLPIWIGQPETDAITIELQERRLHKRPMTHDLLRNIIDEMGAKLVHILVNDVRNDIFYARLVVEIDGRQVEIDSRPSDAIAVAVRAKAPIFVNESVMLKSSVEPEEEIDIYADLDTQPPRLFGSSERPDTPPDDIMGIDGLDAVDESQLSAFSDFVNSLNLDELDDSEEN
jgi:uncharacterized protein